MADLQKQHERNALDLFGQFLMHDVRDTTIDHYERVLNGQMQDKRIGPRLEQFISTLTASEKELLLDLVAEVASTALFKLLWALEERRDVNVLVQHLEVQQNVREASDGLQGEQWGQSGWIKKYSSKRTSPFSIGQ